ncbi:hypothetical protein Vretifemale_2775, partial [Volvox reticuliferus]
LQLWCRSSSLWPDQQLYPYFSASARVGFLWPQPGHVCRVRVGVGVGVSNLLGLRVELPPDEQPLTAPHHTHILQPVVFRQSFRQVAPEGWKLCVSSASLTTAPSASRLATAITEAGGAAARAPAVRMQLVCM